MHAAASRHGVGILVHGIDGVGEGDDGVAAEKLLEVAYVAFRAVADEDLVGVERHAAGEVVVFENGLAEEGVALFRAVAAEGFDAAHFVHGLVQGFDDGGNERL